MRRTRHEYSRWFIVASFAAAMAWVEASVVYDLRTMTDRIQPFQPNPLPLAGTLAGVEMIRESATLVMILMVGLLAGRTWRTRAAYGAIAFGIWDVMYYVFLKAICDWPHSLFDWDILFLLPLPWWGPVIAPVCIALLMVVWGTLVTQVPHCAIATCGWRSWCLYGLGSVLALYGFMAASIRVASRGTDALRHMLPTAFDWVLFGPALALMACPVADIGLDIVRSRRRVTTRPMCAKRDRRADLRETGCDRHVERPRPADR